MKLWDVKTPSNSSGRTPGVCDVVLDSSYQPQEVGRVLASFNLEATPDEFDIETTGDETITINVGAFYRTGNPDHIVIEVFSITIAEDCKATSECVFRTIVEVGPMRPSFTIRGDVVFLLRRIDPHDTATLMAIDYRTGKERVISTTLECEPSNLYEIFVSKGKDILLSFTSSDSMELHVYLEFTSHLQEVSTPNIRRETGDRPTPSDGTLSIPYNENSQYPHSDNWQTFHPRNCYISAQAPVISLSWYGDGDSRRQGLSAGWLDVEDVVGQVKRLGSKAEVTPLERGMHKLHGQVTISVDPETLDTETLWRVSTAGHYTCWVSQSEDLEPKEMIIAPLYAAGQENVDKKETESVLDLPVGLRRLSRLLAFDDETATLAIATIPCSAGCCPTTVHLLGY